MIIRILTMSILILFVTFSYASKNIYPVSLCKGDTIGIVATAYSIREDQLLRNAIKRLHTLGFKVMLSNNIHENYGYLAGTDKQRAISFNKMIGNPKVKGIIEFSGGWGANRILNLIDYDLIKRHPKIIMGFSDFTTLLLAIYAKTGLVTFHGPVAIYSLPKQTTARYFHDILLKGKKITLTNEIKDSDQDIIRTAQTYLIHKGTVTGKLIGGNLTVLAGMLGSHYLPNFKGKILFVEDVGEDAYQIDRLMSQLKNAGILNAISGFIFGECANCTANIASRGSRGGFSIHAVLRQYIKPLNIPAYAGAMFGHNPNMFILPEGLTVKMNALKGSIQMLHSAVALK